MTETESPSIVPLPPDAKVDRLGFCQAQSRGRGRIRGHMLFVPELAPPPGQVAMEMVAKAATRSKEKSK